MKFVTDDIVSSMRTHAAENMSPADDDIMLKSILCLEGDDVLLKSVLLSTMSAIDTAIKYNMDVNDITHLSFVGTARGQPTTVSGQVPIDWDLPNIDNVLTQLCNEVERALAEKGIDLSCCCLTIFNLKNKGMTRIYLYYNTGMAHSMGIVLEDISDEKLEFRLIPDLSTMNHLH